MPSKSLPVLPHSLGQLLLNRGLITANELDTALRLQQEKNCQLGQALIAIRAIDNKTLKRARKRQQWLRPCAACFAFMAPISSTFAADPDHSPEVDNWYSSIAEQQHYPTYINDVYMPESTLERAIWTAWEVYKGEPERGEIRYGLSRNEEVHNSYSLQLNVYF